MDQRFTAPNHEELAGIERSYHRRRNLGVGAAVVFGLALYANCAAGYLNDSVDMWNQGTIPGAGLPLIMLAGKGADTLAKRRRARELQNLDACLNG